MVYRDEDVSVLMDIQPINDGHMLVIPNRHAAGLEALDPAVGARLFRVAQRAARALRASGLPCDGVNLFLADGAAAMQEVFHVHLHVIPRVAGDGFGFRFAKAYFVKPSRPQLESAASAVRTALGSLGGKIHR
jgi:histidine triad (HIT) family protein